MINDDWAKKNYSKKEMKASKINKKQKNKTQNQCISIKGK